MSFETRVEVEFRDQVRVLGLSFRMGIEVMFQDTGWGRVSGWGSWPGFGTGDWGRISGWGSRSGSVFKIGIGVKFQGKGQVLGWGWYSGRRSGSNFGVGSGFKLGSG